VSMTDEQNQRLDWAVGVLQETPALPQGFLERFEEKLSEEPRQPVVLISRGGVTSSRKPNWTRQLMAAVVLLVALAGIVWTLPRSNSPKSSGLMVVAAAQDAKLSRSQGATSPLQTVVELGEDDTLETGSDGPVVLMAGSPGNEIKVAPQSKIRYRTSSSETQTFRSELQLSAGAVFVTETDAKISVRTAHAVFQPVGTDYRVTSSTDSTTLEVLDGVVNARPGEGGSPIQVKAGEQLTVGPRSQWKALRTSKISPQELAPLVRERQSFGRLKQRPKTGAGLPSYPKAADRKPPRPVSRPTSRPKPPNLSALPKERLPRRPAQDANLQPTARQARRVAAKQVGLPERARAADPKASAAARPTARPRQNPGKAAATPVRRVMRPNVGGGSKYPQAQARRQPSNPRSQDVTATRQPLRNRNTPNDVNQPRQQRPQIRADNPNRAPRANAGPRPNRVQQPAGPFRGNGAGNRPQPRTSLDSSVRSPKSPTGGAQKSVSRPTRSPANGSRRGGRR
jgi:FecR protein